MVDSSPSVVEVRASNWLSVIPGTWVEPKALNCVVVSCPAWVVVNSPTWVELRPAIWVVDRSPALVLDRASS